MGNSARVSGCPALTLLIHNCEHVVILLRRNPPPTSQPIEGVIEEGDKCRKWKG